MSLSAVNVGAGSPDFHVYANQSYYEATAGQTIIDPTFVNSTNNFSGSIILSLASPSGVIKSYSFAVNPVNLMPNATVESDLTLATNASAQPNFYTLTINASNSTSTRIFQISISLLSSANSLSASLMLLIGIMIVTAQICFRRMSTTNGRILRHRYEIDPQQSV